jgi:hypothetical protein
VSLAPPSPVAVAEHEARPCAWCGLLTGPGPACTICGSPLIDVSSWSTVLRPEGLVVPAMAAVPLSPETGAPAELGPPSAVWVSLADAASRSGLTTDSLRRWVEQRVREPMPEVDPDGAWFLLIQRSNLDASGLWLVRDVLDAEPEPAPPPARPLVAQHEELTSPEPEVAPPAYRLRTPIEAVAPAVPRPEAPPRPAPARRPGTPRRPGRPLPFPLEPPPEAPPAARLGSDWAFLPPAAQQLRERLQRLAVRGGAAIAVSGAGEALYLLLRR